MKSYKKFKGIKPKFSSEKARIDENIYTFDIETTSFFVINGINYPSTEYLKFSEKERQNSARTTMYVWQFGINDTVYYGRTWEEFKEFIDVLESSNNATKIIFVHNLAFEFQFLKSIFKIDEVIARKSRKPMQVKLKDYNIEFHCTLFLSGVALEKLPEIYDLPIKKMSGDLDYSLIRHSKTKLSQKELKYCENDCLVLYHYIKKELMTYENLKKIPMTSTGKVRRALKEITTHDIKYRTRLRNMISDKPKIFDMLTKAYAGGFTHANMIFTGEIIENVDSYDFVSSYPFQLVSNYYPMSEFKPCLIKKISDMKKQFAYLLHVKFVKVKSKYFNNIISYSKCFNVKGAKLDNGRIIKCEELECVITDVDFNLFLSAYEIKEIYFIESFFSRYDYLPIEVINFILEKYGDKTKFKGIKEKYIEYQLSKQHVNSIYGMTCTNTIRDEVLYDDDLNWYEVELTNETIEKKLKEEKDKGFVNYAWGVWCTSWGRNALLRCVIGEEIKIGDDINGIKRLDDFMIYADTDSLKLAPGYDKRIIEIYNDSVKKKLEKVSKDLKIPLSKFAPKDKNGKEHMLGLFECETENGEFTYLKFVTQGAKKYAYVSLDKNKETGVLEEKIHITVAGVPKSGAKCLKNLDDFKDNLVFDYKTCKKNLHVYIEEQEPILLSDFEGVEYQISDKTGVAILPNEYTLSKSDEYSELISDISSKRSVYNFKKEVLK